MWTSHLLRMQRPWRAEDFGGATQRTFEFRIDPNRRAIRLTAASVFVVRLIIREFVTHVPGPSRKMVPACAKCSGPPGESPAAGALDPGTPINFIRPGRDGSEELIALNRFLKKQIVFTRELM